MKAFYNHHISYPNQIETFWSILSKTLNPRKWLDDTFESVHDVDVCPTTTDLPVFSLSLFVLQMGSSFVTSLFPPSQMT